MRFLSILSRQNSHLCRCCHFAGLRPLQPKWCRPDRPGCQILSETCRLSPPKCLGGSFVIFPSSSSNTNYDELSITVITLGCFTIFQPDCWLDCSNLLQRVPPLGCWEHPCWMGEVVAPKLVGDHPLSCNPGAGDELVPRESLAGWWFQRCFIEIWRAKAEAMDSLRVSMNYKHVSSFLVQILMS